MSRYDDEYKKVCPYCEIEFEAKRINQKFCRNKCKYTFNNRLRKKREGDRAGINNVLNKNHNILKLLYKRSKGDKAISKVRLLEMGYSFNHVTQIGEITGLGEAMGVYNLALIESGNGYYLIDKIA